ncbi:TIGR02301 family protein [Caulobacter segnis]
MASSWPPSSPRPSWPRNATPRGVSQPLDLAYALGESHALRQVCFSRAKPISTRRARMARVTEVEQAGDALDAQMRERFNAGFAARAASTRPATRTAAGRAAGGSPRPGLGREALPGDAPGAQGSDSGGGRRRPR